jgi:hypothetical protein
VRWRGHKSTINDGYVSLYLTCPLCGQQRSYYAPTRDLAWKMAYASPCCRRGRHERTPGKHLRSVAGEIPRVT